MQKAENGNVVRVHYTGTLKDGTVFDSSVEREPFEFTIGNENIIPGFNRGVIGMEVHEKKSITVPASDAYGDRFDELVITLPTSDIPQHLSIQVGQQLYLQNEEGQIIPFSVVDMNAEEVSLDANHPLAGEDLRFDIELVEIVA